ncbi:hypothetical protein [Amycolatopsis sp. WQ 127309]|uniref:hypothetical protein n=1 Tax=Amycolatopsis sp. WQ 127309 TaxID=2932773 RepID=UPI001FF5C6D0|nr:hypothetical protein [Amycolatopsis sp. WQ 127309]UOZ09237.1 hypothetical protein MUY22_13545 [Amycolatopsis sp. WQ 127309]
MPDSYAVHQGRTYEASGRPPGRLALYEGDAQVAEVPIADLDEWYSVRTRGTFLEHEFEVVDERDGCYSLFYMAGDGQWAARVWAEPEAHPDVQFQRQDMYTFIAVTPKDKVADIHEVRTDLLGPWRKEQEERESRES